MIPFTETKRHDHPITKDDWVLEIGAHKGFDTAIFRKQYDCTVVAYEPLEFYYELAERFSDDRKVFPVYYGVCGAIEREEMFGIHGELSGAWAALTTSRRVTLIPITRVIEKWSRRFARPPALLQINAEGGEYEIMNELIASGLVKTIPRIQVQFHSVTPNANVRLREIFAAMAGTHDFMWEPGAFDTGWAGWKKP